jgi:hypothetical protein
MEFTDVALAGGAAGPSGSSLGKRVSREFQSMARIQSTHRNESGESDESSDDDAREHCVKKAGRQL